MMASQFVDAFITVSLQASLIVALAYWISQFSVDEQFQCRLWNVCFVFLLLMVIGAAILPHPRPPFALISPMRSFTAEIAVIYLRVASVLFWGWMLGTILSLLLFIIRSIQTERFVRTCRTWESDSDSRLNVIQSGSTSAAYNKHPKVQILIASGVTSPFCWQFHHPYIVIPESALAFNADDLDLILKHELSHLRSGHPVQIFTQRIVEMIFWFHPMIWWAARSSDLSREFLCDRQAVNSRSTIVRYLKILLKMIEQSPSADEHPCYLPFVRSHSEIAQRAQRLVHVAQSPHSTANENHVPHWRHSSAGIVMALTCAAFAWIPLNASTSEAASWSPWPRWSAAVLHDLGIPVRDFELDGYKYSLHELMEDDDSTR